MSPHTFPPRAAGYGRVCAFVHGGLLRSGFLLFNREGDTGCEWVCLVACGRCGMDGYSKGTVWSSGRRKSEGVLLRGNPGALLSNYVYNI